MTWIDWYNSLWKPSWTPAPATIGLIWQILYPIIILTFGFVFLPLLEIACLYSAKRQGDVSLSGAMFLSWNPRCRNDRDGNSSMVLIIA